MTTRRTRKGEGLAPEAIDAFEKIQGQVEALWSELGQLSKKSPTDAVSKFKLDVTNRLIATANQVLGPQYVPLDDFAGFNLDDVPSNSDVVMVLAQYLACFEKFRSDHIRLEEYGNRWFWNSTLGEISTSPPKKLKNE